MTINSLPNEIVGEIFNYVPEKYLSLCNKNHWHKYYTKKNDNKSRISYARFLLRNDFSFIFEQYVVLNFQFFIKQKKIIYKDKIFSRKIDLFKYLSTFVFNSNKCKNILDDHMKNNRLVFKKIKTKLNKWSN